MRLREAKGAQGVPAGGGHEIYLMHMNGKSSLQPHPEVEGRGSAPEAGAGLGAGRRIFLPP